MHQHVNGRFGFDNQRADDDADRNDNPGHFHLPQFLTQIHAGRHEPKTGAGHEECQAKVSIQDADGNIPEGGCIQMQQEEIQNKKSDGNGENGKQHFFQVDGQP